jgi:predicted ATPase/DNA-binding winged helix-turn-helix (wHTH) protein
MLPTVPTAEDPVYVFDGFVLDPYRRTLAKEGDDIRLGSRALALLIALVEQAGEVLDRHHLVSRVWPRTIVEESSLRVHVAALRRALGDGQDGRRYIANVPGRGYGFVAKVLVQPRAAAEPAAEPAFFPADRPARPLRGAWGRGDAHGALTRLVGQHRMVSLVGPGGVGKTRLALEWAEASRDRFERGLFIVDLAPARDAKTASQCMARSLGIPDDAAASWPSAAAGWGNEACLVVFDNCEHVIDAAGEIAEKLLILAPGAKVLATSREPLNIETERVYRLAGLPVPQGTPASLAEAMQYAAVRLLVERARASGDDVELDDDCVGELCELCRRLDGLPLAMELASARIGPMGLKGLLARTGELLTLLNRGRRSAVPRHRSLHASLDWSYQLLDEGERHALRALSVFPDTFCLGSASAVVQGGAGGHVEERVLRLVDKSLVMAAADHGTGDRIRYRLMHSTRRYAAALLRESGEGPAVRTRHAQDLLRRLDRWNAFVRAPAQPAMASAPSEPSLDEFRAALEASLGSGDGERLGVRLVHAGLDLIRRQGRMADFQSAIEHVLSMPEADLAEAKAALSTALHEDAIAEASAPSLP